MSISFTGLGSGMDYSSWIDQLVEIKMQAVTKLQTKQLQLTTKQNTLNSIKATFNTLRSSLQSISDSKYGGTMDVFSSNTTTQSSSQYVTATVTSNATRQDLSVFVKQLATSTTANSTKTLGKEIDEETVFSKLASSSAKCGTFCIYTDREKHEIEIEKDDSLEDIKNKLETIDGISVNISDGKFSITSDGILSVGSNSDTSNFASILGLTSYSNDNKTCSSSHTITEFNSNAKLLSPDSGIANDLQAGTFKIGNAEFTIDENTTLKSLINEINKNADAGVKATYDYSSGKLTLKSTTTGTMNINIEAGTSNITDILGLTDNGKLAQSSQTAGQNAILTINGTQVTSFSNTVTSEVSGLTGVTLNLTEAMDENAAETKISITQNTDKIFNYVNQMVKDFNSVISQINNTTNVDSENVGTLAYETQLTNIKSSMRTMFMQGQSLSDGTYASLASIGISTGAIGTSVDTDTSQLVLDEAKLREAIENNPEKVKEMLIGTDSSGSNGVINKVLNIVSGALDTTNGYFATKSNTISSELDNLKTKIENKTAQAESYRATLEKQFKRMDETIAKLQEQYSGIDFSNL